MLLFVCQAKGNYKYSFRCEINQKVAAANARELGLAWLGLAWPGCCYIREQHVKWADVSNVNGDFSFG